MNGWLLFEIIINLFQATLITYFVRHRFHIVRPNMLFAALCTFAIWMCLTIHLFVPFQIFDTYIFIFPLIYTFFASDDQWYVKIFWNIALSIALSCVANLMLNLYLSFADATMEQILSETSLRALFVVSTNVGMLLTVFILTRLGRQRIDALSLSALVVFLAILVMELVVVELLYTLRAHFQLDDASFTAASFCMLGCAILTLVLYEIMSASVAKQKMVEAELATARLSQQHYEEIKDMYTFMVAHEHDMKHQFNLIQRLIEDGHTVESKKLLFEQQIPKAIHYEFVTGCIAVDALLTVKKLVMDRHHIEFGFKPYPLRSLPIMESKFCAILSNILDNAIEGTLRIDTPVKKHTIRLSFGRSWDVFFIACENDVNSKTVRKMGSRFLSSKGNANLHGLGTQNVKTIVEQANGKCDYIVTPLTFRVEITLPFEKEAENS